MNVWYLVKCKCHAHIYRWRIERHVARAKYEYSNACAKKILPSSVFNSLLTHTHSHSLWSSHIRSRTRAFLYGIRPMNAYCIQHYHHSARHANVYCFLTSNVTKTNRESIWFWAFGLRCELTRHYPDYDLIYFHMVQNCSFNCTSRLILLKIRKCSKSFVFAVGKKIGAFLIHSPITKYICTVHERYKTGAKWRTRLVMRKFKTRQRHYQRLRHKSCHIIQFHSAVSTYLLILLPDKKKLSLIVGLLKPMVSMEMGSKTKIRKRMFFFVQTEAQKSRNQF